MADFTEKVLKLMERDNISQKQLSELTHISEASISRYLSGKSKPRMDIAANIAKVFGVSTSYLFGELDEDTQKDAYSETICVVARNKTKLTDEQKANIIKLLFRGN
jgi:transcriptional regulator with XRE-family HTH domain